MSKQITVLFPCLSENDMLVLYLTFLKPVIRLKRRSELPLIKGALKLTEGSWKHYIKVFSAYFRLVFRVKL